MVGPPVGRSAMAPRDPMITMTDQRMREAGLNEREALVARYWQEFWSDGRMDFAAEYYAPTYEENLESLTPEAFVVRASRWRAHFEDFTVRLDEVFSVGDRVVSRVTYRGRHTGAFAYLPARGLTFEQSGIDIFEFRASRVVRHWHETDHLELFDQIGAKLVDAGAT